MSQKNIITMGRIIRRVSVGKKTKTTKYINTFRFADLGEEFNFLSHLALAKDIKINIHRISGKLFQFSVNSPQIQEQINKRIKSFAEKYSLTLIHELNYSDCNISYIFIKGQFLHKIKNLGTTVDIKL